jgi:hypothetical protein
MITQLDPGLQSAVGIAPQTPLPVSWLGLPTTPQVHPHWASTYVLTPNQTTNLLAQIGYDTSGWTNGLIGDNNQLGRYQISTVVLENYGLLSAGSNTYYGTDCIYYRHCWQQNVIPRSNGNGNYAYNITNYVDFLNNQSAQDHLAYQLLFDINVALSQNGALKDSDTADIIAGMMYVAWQLGTGNQPGYQYPSGSGAWAWRYHAIGNATNAYVSGRYSMVILSQ